MANINPLSYEEASTESQAIFEQLKKKLGKVPNLYATVGHSSKALSGILSFGQTLSEGEFNGKEVEAIALAVGQTNGCDYCLSAHTTLGKLNGFSELETLELRQGRSGDSKLSVLASLAQEIVESRGHPAQKTLEAFFNVGYSKTALAELIGLVALNTFTNYFNHIAGTDNDFPQAPELLIAA